jgi:hypothetical protein
MKAEVDDKLSRDEFQTAFKEVSEAAGSLPGLAMSVQQLRNEFKRQRDDTDRMIERRVRLVRLHIGQ